MIEVVVGGLLRSCSLALCAQTSLSPTLNKEITYLTSYVNYTLAKLWFCQLNVRMTWTLEGPSIKRRREKEEGWDREGSQCHQLPVFWRRFVNEPENFNNLKIISNDLSSSNMHSNCYFITFISYLQSLQPLWIFLNDDTRTSEVHWGPKLVTHNWVPRWG